LITVAGLVSSSRTSRSSRKIHSRKWFASSVHHARSHRIAGRGAASNARCVPSGVTHGITNAAG